MQKILVIMGSTRPNRKVTQVADWFMKQVAGNKAMSFELIDLADIPLPFIDEPMPPMAGDYQQQHTKDWAAKIGPADGYVFITPEYNHGYPAVLKNAIDYLYAEWRHKPVAFVSYGVQNGVRAVEQLKQVAIQVDLAPINAGVSFSIMTQWSKEGELMPADYNLRQAQNMLNELEWWSTALQAARAKTA